MRHMPRAVAALGVGFAVSCLAACGGGAGLLSGQQAANLGNALNSVSSAVQNGDCPAATREGQNLQNQVADLPGTINSTLSTDLSQGASTVSQLAVQDCHATKAASTPATTASTSTTSTAPTTSTTSSTATSTSPSTSTGTGPATTTSPTGTTSTQPTGGGGLPGSGTGTAGSGSGGGSSGAGSGSGSGGGN